MDKITKITTGDASFVLEQEFENEEKAEKGTEPASENVKSIEIKIDNIKWRKNNE